MDAAEEETPSSASMKKPQKRKAKEVQPKEVRGLPIHLREECKQFLNCTACIHEAHTREFCPESLLAYQVDPAWHWLPHRALLDNIPRGCERP